MLLAWLSAALAAMAAERLFDFGPVATNQLPSGFRSVVSGQGSPGDWQAVVDETPEKRVVLAQLAQDPTDEHFPLLVFDDEIFSDFALTTRFKTVAGKAEQMAGIAFRIQNETNYYVVRASSLGNSFRFYKVVDGQRSPPIGPQVLIRTNVWHELGIECKGNEIRCRFDGKEAMPPLNDMTFTSGKVGFWTKSDSVSYFADTRIVYTPREIPAQAMVRALAKKYARLVGLQLYVRARAPGTTRLLASKVEAEVGKAGGKTELAVLDEGTTYYGNEKESVSVVLPLRDRNGDPMAAVRVIMKSYSGQTEQNAIIRAMPILKEMQAKATSLQDLL